MDWIFDNLQLILVVAGAIAYWLNQRAREKAGQEADYDQDGIPEHRPPPLERSPGREIAGPLARQAGDLDQEERARRIREEIQRKIAERRGQAVPPVLAEPPRLPPILERPVFREEAEAPYSRSEPTPPPMPQAPAQAYSDSAALERQRRLAEEFERLEEQREAARRAAAAARAASREAAPVYGAAPVVGAMLGLRSVGEELRDPRALRRAFVLREVISPPVGLR